MIGECHLFQLQPFNSAFILLILSGVLRIFGGMDPALG
jgi:hypothetical protein